MGGREVSSELVPFRHAAGRARLPVSLSPATVHRGTTSQPPRRPPLPLSFWVSSPDDPLGREALAALPSRPSLSSGSSSAPRDPPRTSGPVTRGARARHAGEVRVRAGLRPVVVVATLRRVSHLPAYRRERRPQGPATPQRPRPPAGRTDLGPAAQHQPCRRDQLRGAGQHRRLRHRRARRRLRHPRPRRQLPAQGDRVVQHHRRRRQRGEAPTARPAAPWDAEPPRARRAAAGAVVVALGFALALGLRPSCRRRLVRGAGPGAVARARRAMTRATYRPAAPREAEPRRRGRP